MAPRIRPCAALLAAALFVTGADRCRADQPLHEKQTAAAWEAFKKADYAEAVRRADICIDEFSGSARRRQKELDEQKERVPSGRGDARQKEAIFRNGTLNDVATCYYIKGRALDKLGRKDDAAKALAAAAQFPAARAWDTRGWFWAPAEAAERYRKNPDLADKAPHEVYTAEAWDAYNRGAHAKAIEAADKCLEEFRAAAQEAEKELARRGVRLPTGAVDEATKKRIFENGMLNDVATCAYIKGRSAEAAGDKKSAAKAYRDAVQLPHGRCWDPQGWFWSPAEGASDRLEIIR
jgi:hypothetical protein